jgi:hypothetical protein
MAKQKKVLIERPNSYERIVHLDYPIKLGSEGDPAATVSSITLKKPKVRDILAAGKDGGSEDERQVRLMSVLSSQLPSVLEEVYASDWERLTKAFEELRYPPEFFRAVSTE